MTLNNDPHRPLAEEADSQYRSIFQAVGDGMIIHDSETGLVVEANSAAAALHGYSREEFIGLHWTAYIHPDSQRLFNESVMAANPGEVSESSALHVHRDGSSFYVEARRTDFSYQSRPCLLSVVRDVSKRIQAEHSLQQRVDTRTHEQAVLLEISHSLASTLEFHPGLILQQLRGIIGYTHGGLFALEGSTLVTLAMLGTPQLERSSAFRIYLQGPETLAALFNEHRPVRIADLWNDDPQAQFLRSLLGDGAAMLLEGMQSWLWVPLAVKKRMLGGMGLAHEARDYFTPHHADLALSVANQAALSMINAELYGQAKALAALEERQRLARNLHDAVNQSLFSAGLIAEVLPRLWERDQEQARQSLLDLRGLTRGAIAEMRALLAELRPSTLTEVDLADLLRLLGTAFTGRTNMPATVIVSGGGALPAEVQVAFYRVCQEALNNVARHARAGSVEIHLTQRAGAIELSIRDDGQGFDAEQTASGHYGLSMMRERAEAVGAALSIRSQPGHGTELTIRWTKTARMESL